MKLKLKGIVVQNLDSYEEEEGRVWDSYEVIAIAPDLKTLEKIKEDMECTITIEVKDK